VPYEFCRIEYADHAMQAWSAYPFTDGEVGKLHEEYSSERSSALQIYA
jgi:hypothetical protein